MRALVSIVPINSHLGQAPLSNKSFYIQATHASLTAGTIFPRATGPQNHFKLKMNTIEPPPERFSKAWFESKYASWKAQPRSLKWVQVVILSLVFVFILKWSWKFVWGLFYYSLAYGKAALQYGVSFEPCLRVMRETYPWRALGNEEYFRRMRCEGNDHGSDRQGNLIPTFGGFIGWLFDPYAFSSWAVSPQTRRYR